MSLAKRLASEAGRSSYATGRTNQQGQKRMQSQVKAMDMQVAALNKELEKLPGLMQAASFGKGLRPAARVVQKRVKELTPRSKKTDRDKRSAKEKLRRANDKPLWKTTKIKLWRGSAGFGVGMVGFTWPDGNIGHVVIESKNTLSRHVLWGNMTMVERRRKKDVLKRAFDESKKAAAAAWVAAVSRDVDNQLRTLGRG